MPTAVRQIPYVNDTPHAYVAFNSGIECAENALNAYLEVDMLAGNVTLTTVQFLSAGIFIAVNQEVARTLTVPALKSRFVVLNLGVKTLTVKRGTTEIDVFTLKSKSFYVDGTTNGLYTIEGGLLVEGYGLQERLRDFIDTPAAKTYVIEQEAPYDYVINTLAYQMSAGTATIEVQIDGVAVTGLSALGATTGAQTATASALNHVPEGSRVTLVVSSPSGAANLAYAVSIEREPAVPPPLAIETFSTATIFDEDITITKPTDTENGDFLLAFIAAEGNIDITPPAGWTEVIDELEFATGVTLGVWRKTASSEGASYLFDWPFFSSNVSGGILRIVGSNNAVNVAGSDNHFWDNSFDAPSVVTTVPNTMLIHFIATYIEDPDTLSLPGTGETNVSNVAITFGSFKMRATVSFEMVAAAGATGTRTYTISGGGGASASAMIAIAPA
jgi:hypothetical protein